MFHMWVMEHAHNFEICSALITIILLGKYIEQVSKKKTMDKLSELASLKVSKANLVENSEKQLEAQSREIPIDLVQINDLLKVYPGQGIPVDGIVELGQGIANESMLTGESIGIDKIIGSRVYGGSILTQGTLILRAIHTSENSSINQIIKLVENA